METAQPARASDQPALDLLTDQARVAAVERIVAAGPASGCVQRLTTLAAPRTPALDSMCSITVALAPAFVVEDAAGHPWVQDLPPVTSGLVSSYLCVVLTDCPGHIRGSLCVYGSEPRAWTDADVDTLAALGEAVADELEDTAAAS